MQRDFKDRAVAYDDLRVQAITENREKMEILGVRSLVAQAATFHLTKPVEKQKKKRSLDETISESNRVLRSCSNAMHESDDEGGGETMVVDQQDEGHGLGGQQKTRNGRKRTQMHTVYDRKGQPPILVSFNEKGQPDGPNASEFSNFIATHVKSHIPLGYADWRQVPVENKNELMNELRKYYVVDDKLKDYVMGSGHKKWKDFKADLKEKIYKEERTDEELQDLFKKDTRVTPTDVDWLITFWRSEQAKKRSEQGKKNREKQKVLHTSESKSHARVTTEMHKENGFPPRRDEVFIRTHQSKKGKLQNEETIKVIKILEKAMEEHPELLEKTIQQGDLFAYVQGAEKNGYVRCVGLGPNAGTLGMPGGQKLKSIKLQMAELEAEKAWRAHDILQEQVDEIRNDTKSQVDALMEEVNQLRMLVSQSNAGKNNSMLDLELFDSVGESAACDDDELYANHNERLDEEMRQATEKFERAIAEAALLRKNKEATLILEKKRKQADLSKKEKEADQLQKEEEGLLQKKKDVDQLQKKEADQLQKKKEEGLLQKKKEQVQLQKKLGAVVTQKNHQQGNEVILYNVFRDHSTRVAKGTILSTDRKKIVRGRELGTECCEVVINYIIKKDAILFRPVGNVKTMGQA